jgi:hypothetical protein
MKRKFTREEDQVIRAMVSETDTPSWSVISRAMLGRTARQCRERWRHYLQPEISGEPWTAEEDQRLREQFEANGPKWSIIATKFRGRTEVNIKNRWSILKRRSCREKNRFAGIGEGQIEPEPLPGIGEIIALDSVKMEFGDADPLFRPAMVERGKRDLLRMGFLEMALARPNFAGGPN